MKRFFLLVTGSFALLIGVPFAHAQTPTEPPVPFIAYQSDIDQLASLLSRKSGDTEDATIRALREKLAATARVRMPGGQVVVLDREPFAAGQSTKNVRVRISTIKNLLAALTPTGSKGDPRADAKSILAAPEFAEASEAPPDDNWFERLMRRIGDAIRRFFEWLFGGKRNAPQTDTSGIAAFVTTLLRFLLFALIAVGVVWGGLLVFRWSANRAPGKKRAGVLDDLDDGEVIADALQAARDRAAQGEMRQALRLAYIACLRRLAASGSLVLQKSRTNWEYQNALRARAAEAYTTLLPATRLFDQVWYGKREATTSEFDQLMAIHDALPAPLVDVATVDKGTGGGKGAERAGTAGTTGTPEKPEDRNAW